MNKEKEVDYYIDAMNGLGVDYKPFGPRLREIRKRRGLSQEEFAKILGTHKQLISMYEREERSPRVTQVRKFAKRLNVSVAYMLGDDEAEDPRGPFWRRKEGKPFYQIFKEVVYDAMGLTTEEIIRITGLPESQIRIIEAYRVEVPPLCLAMCLAETLNVPIEVWAGQREYEPADISVHAFEIARAYMKADERAQTITRMIFDLELNGEQRL